MNKTLPDDERWMQRAIELARLSEGHTRPNPPVGAVVIKEGRIIGEGHHQRAGEDHAEVVALKACVESAQDATLYVTLEPCSTYGRTPPCTERIIEAGIKRVVIGCEDCFRDHCGAGYRILKQNKIEVLSGVGADQAHELAAPFFKHTADGMPYLTLKLGMTMDGCIADRHNCSQWITGEQSRAEVQQLRRRADVILVGSRTVCADDPSLLCRLPNADNQMRAVIDSQGVIPASAQILTDSAAERTLVFTSTEIDNSITAAWSCNGARVIRLQASKGGHLALVDVLRELGAMDLMHVVCEGGGELAGALRTARLIDEYVLFYAPAILGDVLAKRGFSSNGVLLLKDMPRMKIKDICVFGDDLRVRMLAENKS
ncbi:MAG: bifunctional diaminohydroxyphosphoribosylaminopyrimidine deaminase/5-amino-6-(5-phosphoribosylamino)uracil reductase RibD [Kiritimatiellia bacterium]